MKDCKCSKESGDIVVGVESTGNTRYFKRMLEEEGIPVKVINTMKFKVITESVKKTDMNDDQMIAEFLEKDMLPDFFPMIMSKRPSLISSLLLR